MGTMSSPKALTWNATQVAISNLLDGGVAKSDTAKQLGVSKALVTKVANAKAKGQSQSTPYVPHPQAGPLKKLHQTNPATQFTGVNNQTTGVNSDTKPPVNPETKPTSKGTDSSLLLLKPLQTNCALTPIMLNARYIAIREFNWPQDVSWEDFFDTCLVHLFRCWGWGLQEAYKLDDQTHGAALKPASEKAEGSGPVEDKGYKQHEQLGQATKLGLVMMEILGQVKKQPAH